MNNTVQWIIGRLKERSTWIGLTTIAASVGVVLEPQLQEAIIAAGLAIAGLIGVITKDKA